MESIGGSLKVRSLYFEIQRGVFFLILGRLDSLILGTRYSRRARNLYVCLNKEKHWGSKIINLLTIILYLNILKPFIEIINFLNLPLFYTGMVGSYVLLVWLLGSSSIEAFAMQLLYIVSYDSVHTLIISSFHTYLLLEQKVIKMVKDYFYVILTSIQHLTT